MSTKRYLNGNSNIDIYMEKIVRKVIYRLQRVPKEAMIYCDGELNSFWEEVCVLVQTGSVYDSPTMEDLIEGYCLDVFEKLPWPDQLLISLAACDDRGVEYEPYAIYPDEAVAFLYAKVTEYAGNYSNERIAEYVY